MGKSHKITLLLIVTLVVLVGGYFFWNIQNEPSNSIPKSVTGVKTNNQKIVTDGVYINKTYGFRFSYPEGWYVGTDNLKHGTLQLFNYKDSDIDVKGQGDGKNKIEVVVVKNNPFEPSSDYPEKTNTTTEVEIAGKKAVRSEIELTEGEKILGYLIPLINADGEFIAITIYGDSSNFYILENLIASFEWIK